MADRRACWLLAFLVGVGFLAMFAAVAGVKHWHEGFNLSSAAVCVFSGVGLSVASLHVNHWISDYVMNHFAHVSVAALVFSQILGAFAPDIGLSTSTMGYLLPITSGYAFGAAGLRLSQLQQEREWESRSGADRTS